MGCTQLESKVHGLISEHTGSLLHMTSSVTSCCMHAQSVEWTTQIRYTSL